MLVVYGTTLKIVAHKYRWVKFDLQLMTSYFIGSFGCGALGYGLYKLVAYVLSLIGSVDASPITNIKPWSYTGNMIVEDLNHWPYIAYSVIIIAILLATLFDRLPERQNKDEFSVLLVLLLIPASLVLPWFSEHYWWYLLATFIFMPLVVFFVYGYKEKNKIEALGITRIFTVIYFGLSHLNVLLYWLFSSPQ